MDSHRALFFLFAIDRKKIISVNHETRFILWCKSNRKDSTTDSNRFMIFQPLCSLRKCKYVRNNDEWSLRKRVFSFLSLSYPHLHRVQHRIKTKREKKIMKQMNSPIFLPNAFTHSELYRFFLFFFSIYFLWSPLFSYSKCKESNFRRIIFTFLSYCILLFYRAITWNAFKCNLFLSFDEHWTLFCTHSFRNWWYTYAYVYV